MIPASCAVVSASPFGKSCRRRNVADDICTRANATARRWDSGLLPTSTIRTEPDSSTWLSSLIATASRGASDHAASATRRATDRHRRRRAHRAPLVARAPSPRRTGTTTPPAAGVDVLHAHPLVQAVLRARPPEARRLDSAPRGLTGRERVAEVVHPHHAGVDLPCHPAGFRRSRVHTLAASPNSVSFARAT